MEPASPPIDFANSIQQSIFRVTLLGEPLFAGTLERNQHGGKVLGILGEPDAVGRGYPRRIDVTIVR